MRGGDVLVRVRVLSFVQLGGCRRYRVLLLGEVVVGVRRLGLGELLLGGFDRGLLRGNVLLRRRLLGECQLLGRLVNGILGGLNILWLRPGIKLIEVRLIRDELLARGFDLRLGGLDLSIEAAVLGCRQTRLGEAVGTVWPATRRATADC